MAERVNGNTPHASWLFNPLRSPDATQQAIRTHLGKGPILLFHDYREAPKGVPTMRLISSSDPAYNHTDAQGNTYGDMLAGQLFRHVEVANPGFLVFVDEQIYLD